MSKVKKISFLKDFRKKTAAMKNVVTDFSPPNRWYSTGNLALNRQMSGSFECGIPESRITVLAGPSGSGKTFLACNLAREAQKKGAFVVYVDSENAVDKQFVQKLGVNIAEDMFDYNGLKTFDDVAELFSTFLSGYEKDYGRNNPDAPPTLFILDSIDMLLTSKEDDNRLKGVQKGDQGQRTKQIKHLLRTITISIADFPITFIATHQVYKNQDVMNGEGVWIVNNAVKYSASQIFLCTKLKLKDGLDVIGIKMRVEAYKTRFTQTGTKIEIEVPYVKGMNPYSGLLEDMEKLGIVSKGGSWYTLIDAQDASGKPIKFQKKGLTDELVQRMLDTPKVREIEALAHDVMSEADIDPDAYEVAQLGSLESSDEQDDD